MRNERVEGDSGGTATLVVFTPFQPVIRRMNMIEKERLLKALFPVEGRKKLLNLKFSARDPTITEEELCREFADALDENPDSISSPFMS